MAENYNISLVDKLPSNNGKNIILNKKFNRWKNYIMDNISNIGYDVDGTYDTPLSKRVLAFAQKHIRKNRTPLNNKDVIALVHPFYLHLNQMYLMENQDILNQANKSLDILLNFLESTKENNNLDVVVLESLPSYGAVTSILLEKGYVNDVILTENDRGSFFNRGEAVKFLNKNVYFGGGYNNRCLSAAINETMNVTKNKNMWAIRELCLNSPEDTSKLLNPRNIVDLYLWETISQEKFNKKINTLN